MAIKVQTYKSQVGGRNYIKGRAALQAPVLRPSNSADHQLKLKTAKVAEQAAIRTFEVNTATDLVSAENEYRRELMEFEADYKNTKLRKDARTADKDFEDKNRELAAKYAERFAGNARGQRLWLASSSQIKTSSVNRGINHRDSEDQIYKKETAEGMVATYTQKVSAQNGNEVAINNLRTQINARLKAIYPERDLTAIMAGIDLKTAVTRIQTSVAQKDHAEAKRLLKDYKSVLGTSYPQMVNSVESAKKVDMKEMGSTYAMQAFNDKIPAEKVWKEISNIKDTDMRNAAQRQYSTMWTMQNNIDTQAYQDGAIAISNQIKDMPVNDIASQQLLVDKLPEETEVDRKKKEFAQSLVDARKSGLGIDKLSDGGAFMAIRDDILRGAIIKPEQVKADTRSTGITERDKDDLIDILEASQMATDRQINDAFKNAYGAKNWAKKNKDVQFKLLQQVKASVKETNRGQDTGYIQSVVDSLSMGGEERGRFFPGYGEDKDLAAALIDLDISMEELSTSLYKGEAQWLPDDVPDEMKQDWASGAIGTKKQWMELYPNEKEALRAAYLQFIFEDTGKRGQ